jgi:1-acyl-sn-glycerol-3-phosphate acyltransferase/cytidylate kinase
MIFPEGGRSKNGKVQKGHTGAALIAARSGKPIVPVGVVYGDKLGFRTKVTLKFGKPIDPAEYAEICDSPNPRQLVKLKNRYMEEIKKLVECDEVQDIKEDKDNA